MSLKNGKKSLMVIKAMAAHITKKKMPVIGAGICVALLINVASPALFGNLNDKYIITKQEPRDDKNKMSA